MTSLYLLTELDQLLYGMMAWCDNYIGGVRVSILALVWFIWCSSPGSVK